MFTSGGIPFATNLGLITPLQVILTSRFISIVCILPIYINDIKGGKYRNKKH